MLRQLVGDPDGALAVMRIIGEEPEKTPDPDLLVPDVVRLKRRVDDIINGVLPPNGLKDQLAGLIDHVSIIYPQLLDGLPDSCIRV